MDPPRRTGFPSGWSGERVPAPRSIPNPPLPPGLLFRPLSHRNTGSRRQPGLPSAWDGQMEMDPPESFRNPLIPPVSYARPTIPIFPGDISNLLAQRAMLRRSIRDLQSRAIRLAQDAQALREEQGLASLASTARRLLHSWTNPTLWIQAEKNHIRMQIEATSTAKLAPKMNETELIQKLVCNEKVIARVACLMIHRFFKSFNMTATSRRREHLQKKFLRRRRP
jgi:hypothetical protein